MRARSLLVGAVALPLAWVALALLIVAELLARWAGRLGARGWR